VAGAIAYAYPFTGQKNDATPLTVCPISPDSEYEASVPCEASSPSRSARLRKPGARIRTNLSIALFDRTAAIAIEQTIAHRQVEQAWQNPLLVNTHGRRGLSLTERPGDSQSGL
jgi:hypothetical protein